MTRLSHVFSKENLQRILERRKGWIFPLIILLILVLLTSFKISGTSVGMYHEKLYGDNAKDPSLIFNQPRAIRSDEWGVNTPYVVSQSEQGFPLKNSTPGNGQDISLTFDTPVADWSTLFKPQNLSFFILPLENAFAFKWWSLVGLLILATYAFILTLLPKKYLIASLIATVLGLSPFVHWWYQSATILPLAYGLFIAALGVYLIQTNPIKERPKFILALITLAYLLTCYLFLLYIPFILPIALAVGAFLVGYLLNYWRDNKVPRKNIRQKVILILVPVLISIGLTLVFVKSHATVVEALSNSVYPGQRTVSAGGFTLQQLFGGYFNMQLQDDTKAIQYELNQSEASNFMLLFPFLLPLFIYLWRKTNKVDWRAVFLLALSFIFCVYLFVPFAEPLFNLIQLSRVPHNRLLIGIGMINILLIAIILEQFIKYRHELPRRLIIMSSLLALVFATGTGILLKVSYDGYLESLPKIVAVSVIVALVVYLFLIKRFVPAFGIFVALSFVSVVNINPLYQGLGMLTNSQITSTIRATGSHEDSWIVDDHVAFLETFPAVAGARSLSGVYAYPQLDVWKSLGTDSATQAIYNRYAHVFFSVGNVNRPDITQGAYFDPPALDAFHVNADACSPFLKEQRVTYVLTPISIESSCATKLTEISYPLANLFVYKLTYNK